MVERMQNKNSLECIIARIYLFCLPIRTISLLSEVASYLHGAATYFDFFLNMLGLVLYVLRKKGKVVLGKGPGTFLFDFFVKMVFLLNASSLLMACFIQAKEGSYAGETAFSGILGMVVYYFQFVLIILYNRIVFGILDRKTIRKTLKHLCVALLVLGYWQAAALTVGGAFLSSLQTIDVFNILWNEGMWKLCLTGIEGATAGGIFAILVLPFLLSEFHAERKRTVLLQIVLWLPILVLMQSTSAYFMVIADIIGYILFCFTGKRSYKSLILRIICVAMLLLLALLFTNEAFWSIIPSNIRYLVLRKATDLSNGSTVSRTVPLYTNWKTFLKYPLFGVGNGLQGYYYIRFFPPWASAVAGSDIMKYYAIAQNEIVNGGVFFPGFLSGYGLFGLSLLVIFIVRCRRRVADLREEDAFWSTFYCIAIFAVIVCGFQGEIVGVYYILFVISLPFIDFGNIEKGSIK